MSKRGAGHGEFLRARQHPAEQLFLAPFLHNAHLQMKTTKISLRTNGMAATEHRTGNQAVFALFVSPSSSSLISAPSRYAPDADLQPAARRWRSPVQHTAHLS
jgi:hypothetical protein